jgi:hypothetical protein
MVSYKNINFNGINNHVRQSKLKMSIKNKKSHNVLNLSHFYIKSQILPFGPKHAVWCTQNIL